MSRYCPHDISAVVAAAQQMKDTCLVGDGSVLSTERLWASEGFEELQHCFVERPDEGDRKFLDKLKDQLAAAHPSSVKLAAELLWVIFLFPVPAAIKAEKKRGTIRQVWSWSGETLPSSAPALEAPLESGIGNPGSAYHRRRWAELGFLIQIGRQLKAKSKADRQALFEDPWRFAEWLDGISPDEHPQLRHILRFLLFPDYFERIAAPGDKQQIIAAFSSHLIGELRNWPYTQLDRELYKIRHELETKHKSQELDFYRPPLRDQWREAGLGDIGYWKIAPGENARLWDMCRQGGFIAVGWSDTGDLSDFERGDFDARVEAVLKDHPDWNRSGMDQLWQFTQIGVGDRIVANRGTREVLGIGTVTGSYYFVAGEEYGHRLPVTWDDLNPRVVDEGGWRRTLIKLREPKFREIVEARGPQENARRFWLEKTHVSNRPFRQAGPNAVGAALLSPQKSKDGKDIYAAMREVRPGDVVMHLTDNAAITGVSIIAGPAVDASPNDLAGTEWANQPALRVALRGFQAVDPPLSRADLLENPTYRNDLLDICAKHSGLFYNSRLELYQGAYLTSVPEELAALLNEAYRPVAKRDLPYLDGLERRGQSNCWIFQANPRLFDIDRALQDLAEMTWLVSQHKDKVKAGDRAFVWRSGPDAAVVGELELAEDPRAGFQLPEEAKYALDDEKFGGEQVRARCRVIRRFAEPISKHVILATPALEGLTVLRAPQGTNFLLTTAQAEALRQLVEQATAVVAPLNPTYAAEDLSVESGFELGTVNDWLAKLRRKKHLVFQGPPGTGKTYLAERLCRVMLSANRGFCETLQFHPSYAYEDFIQGIRPEVVDGQLSFRVTAGRFLDFCARAAALPASEPCVLVIDELNRANLSRVFGELMYLLEYRDREVPLAAGGRKLRVPTNVYVVGTMNTADRSIALVDHALRRRFSFVFLGPEYEVLEKHVGRYGLPAVSLVTALRQINKAIGDRNYELGISFFLSDGPALRQNLPAIWQGEVEPYLEEYFFDQPDKVKPWTWRTLSKSTLADWV